MFHILSYFFSVELVFLSNPLCQYYFITMNKTICEGLVLGSIISQNSADG